MVKEHTLGLMEESMKGNSRMVYFGTLKGLTVNTINS